MKASAAVPGAHAEAPRVGSLTDESFWESYWGRFTLPDAVDERRSFDRALARELRRVLKGTEGTVLEVGCAPGRWLAWMHSELRLSIAGIEFTARTEIAFKAADSVHLVGRDRHPITIGARAASKLLVERRTDG